LHPLVAYVGAPGTLIEGSPFEEFRAIRCRWYNIAREAPQAMRRRFFVERFEGRRARLHGEAAHHLGRVLRAQPGQLYELSDGQAVWLGRVESVVRDAVEFALVEPVAASAPDRQLTLLLAVVKFDRFEWALEKATELGATEIIPLAATRSERALVSAAPKRAARWQKILLEAAQQSRRLQPPALRPCAAPRETFRNTQAGIKIVLSERPEAPSLRSVLAGMTAREDAAALAVGPEGGWTDQEFEAARAVGFREASLGASILRTETAVVAALAVLNFALGE
jgi:16S rRNA (uracil1498-N3)-methyltransferase